MIHVFPIGDEREHDTESTMCWCSPVVEWNNPETGKSYSEALVIHNSKDWREVIEQVEQIVKEAGE